MVLLQRDKGKLLENLEKSMKKEFSQKIQSIREGKYEDSDLISFVASSKKELLSEEEAKEISNRFRDISAQTGRWKQNTIDRIKEKDPRTDFHSAKR